jgi:iron complex outermembrane recepter protein
LNQQSYTIRRPYQDVTHQLLKSKTQFTRNGHKFTIQLAGQFNKRKEFDVTRTSTNKKPQLNLTISTLSEDISWEHPVKGNFSGVVGVAAMQQDNAYAGRYFIPNYRSNTFGGYAIEKWARHKWEAQAGIRYDNKGIVTNRLIAGQSIFDHYNFNFSTLAAALNGAFKANDHWKLNATISLASRAPHVNELLSNGIHHGTATYEEGDITLKPEQSLNISTGINYHNKTGTLLLDVDLYSNRINDFIYRQPKPEEPVLTIAGAFPKIKYQQTNARLTGMDVAVVAKPVPAIEWINKLSLLRARDRRTNDWLIGMPADRVSTELVYNFKTGHAITGSYLSLEIQQVFEQTRVPGEKNGRQDYKAPPDAYTVINLHGAFTISIRKFPVTCSIGVRNLFNNAYRDYMNSMRYFTDETGRNICLRLKIPVEQLY